MAAPVLAEMQVVLRLFGLQQRHLGRREVLLRPRGLHSLHQSLSSERSLRRSSLLTRAISLAAGASGRNPSARGLPGQYRGEGPARGASTAVRGRRGKGGSASCFRGVLN